MSRLQARIIKLEACSRHGWRSYIGRPVVEWPDEALLGLLGKSQGWPLEHEPTHAELEAIAAGWGCEKALLKEERDALSALRGGAA